MRYSGDDNGTAYTWKSSYLGGKDHLQFELLGLDDQSIPSLYEEFSRMVVEDIVDDCRTVLRPAKMMEDIYRVWCETKGVKWRLHRGEEDPYGYREKYEAYLDNEYREYVNPELKFRDGSCVWSLDEDDGWFEIAVPDQSHDDDCSCDDCDEGRLNQFREQLDEYFVSVFRAEGGEMKNESRYLLPPTPLSKFIYGVEDGVKCRISPWQSSTILGDKFVPEQVVFTGTQNPFNYDNDGERVYSRTEELQYGNSICGVDEMEVRIEIRTDEVSLPKVDANGFVVAEESIVDDSLDRPTIHVEPEMRSNPVVRKWVKPVVTFKKNQLGDNPTLAQTTSWRCMTIPAGEVLVTITHKNMDNIAKYHILNRSSSLYYCGSLPKNGSN